MNSYMDQNTSTYHQIENIQLKLENELLKLELKLYKQSKDNEKEQNFYRSVLENIPSDIVVFDINHHYLYVNPLAIKDTETRNWIIGKNDFDFCKRRNRPIEIAETRRKVFEKVIETKQEIFFEEKMINFEGKTIWNLRKMHPILDSKGDIIFVIGYASDITHIKNMEQELNDSTKKATESFKIKEEFLANMSHEIRTPMNAILGMSDLLLKEGFTGKHLNYLQGINKGAKNLLVVINDILDFSKVSSNQLEFENISVNLNKEMKDIETLFQLKCIEKDISLLIDIDPILKNKLIKTDPVRLNQILNNLLSNALKFTKKGQVSLLVKTVREDDEYFDVTFCVKDTGIGISSENFDKIFIPFSQADSSTTRKFGGTGLGLSITKLLVGKMGGELKIKSTEGIGSEFYFTLPLQKCKHKTITIHPSLNEELILPDDFSVLVVEDNPMNQLYVQALLENFTNKISVVNNGEEAINSITKQNFSLILMDIQMPIMGGEECTNIIRNELKLKTPIVALTANAFKDDQKKYLALGMDGYLSKPFSQNELTDCLKQILTLNIS